MFKSKVTIFLTFYTISIEKKMTLIHNRDVIKKKNLTKEKKQKQLT